MNGQSERRIAADNPLVLAGHEHSNMLSPKPGDSKQTEAGFGLLLHDSLSELNMRFMPNMAL